jgi:penicillin-insensitive murein endopeptidase
MRLLFAAPLCLVMTASVVAQDLGTLHPKALPPLAHPEDPATPAKAIFGRKTEPTGGASKVIGFYAKGCLAGGQDLPIDGPSWQVMRLSRNRNWGHPRLINFLEKVSGKLKSEGVWPGFLVGDMAQPRGGPMITGHASHQIGLDADIWLMPMPGRTFSRAEREETSATNMVRSDRLDVDYSRWTPNHLAIARGCRSCDRFMVTTITSTFALRVRLARRTASIRSRRRPAMAVIRLWTGGSRIRFCTPSRTRTTSRSRP